MHIDRMPTPECLRRVLCKVLSQPKIPALIAFGVGNQHPELNHAGLGAAYRDILRKESYHRVAQKGHFRLRMRHPHNISYNPRKTISSMA